MGDDAPVSPSGPEPSPGGPEPIDARSWLDDDEWDDWNDPDDDELDPDDSIYPVLDTEGEEVDPSVIDADGEDEEGVKIKLVDRARAALMGLRANSFKRKGIRQERKGDEAGKTRRENLSITQTAQSRIVTIKPGEANRPSINVSPASEKKQSDIRRLESRIAKSRTQDAKVVTFGGNKSRERWAKARRGVINWTVNRSMRKLEKDTPSPEDMRKAYDKANKNRERAEALNREKVRLLGTEAAVSEPAESETPVVSPTPTPPTSSPTPPPVTIVPKGELFGARTAKNFTEYVPEGYWDRFLDPSTFSTFRDSLEDEVDRQTNDLIALSTAKGSHADPKRVRSHVKEQLILQRLPEYLGVRPEELHDGSISDAVLTRIGNLLSIDQNKLTDRANRQDRADRAERTRRST